MVDLDGCGLSSRNGTYAGAAGSKEGIVYRGENWIVKYPKSTRGMRVKGLPYTTSPLSEFIGSRVYEILGFDVHRTLLGTRNGKIVVACRDFCSSPGSLLEIRALKNIYNRRLEEELQAHLSSTGSEHITDLTELLIHLDYNPILSHVPGIKERFWDCVIVDGLIGNNDRNNSNWGVLNENGEYRLAPIYDNGAAFSGKLSDEVMANRVVRRDLPRVGALNVDTAYGADGGKLSFADILSIKSEDLRLAIERTVPKIRDRFGEMRDLIAAIPEEYGGLPVISPARKEVYTESMAIRLNELLLPALRGL